MTKKERQHTSNRCGKTTSLAPNAVAHTVKPRAFAVKINRVLIFRTFSLRRLLRIFCVFGKSYYLSVFRAGKRDIFVACKYLFFTVTIISDIRGQKSFMHISRYAYLNKF